MACIVAFRPVSLARTWFVHGDRIGLRILLTGMLGEIDVMEAVEQANTGNQVTLHTDEGCTMKVKRKEYGTVLDTNCWNETNDNAGCGVKGADDTYGEAFNDNGGGVSDCMSPG